MQPNGVIQFADILATRSKGHEVKNLVTLITQTSSYNKNYTGRSVGNDLNSRCPQWFAGHISALKR